MRGRGVIAALTAVLTFASSGSSGQLVLAPDIAFHMQCSNGELAAVEKAIEAFLEREGFRVLNRARIQQQHGVRLLDLDMVGLDNKRRIIDFIALPRTPGRYAVTLVSEPPTRRAAELEERLLSFPVSLHCEVRQLSRSQNGAERRAFFDDEVRRMESLFRQADALKGKYSL